MCVFEMFYNKKLLIILIPLKLMKRRGMPKDKQRIRKQSNEGDATEAKFSRSFNEQDREREGREN